MKVAIVGSRSGVDTVPVWEYVMALPAGTTVVSGGAYGVDVVAERAAKHRGLPTIIFKPDWQAHGKRAGFLRNEQIVAAADRVVAFWNGSSRGTMLTVDIARAAGKSVEIILPSGESAASKEEGG